MKTKVAATMKKEPRAAMIRKATTITTTIAAKLPSNPVSWMPTANLPFTFPTKPDERHRDLRYRIEARVTDDANREISGVNFVVATYGKFALGVSTESYIYKPGDKIVAVVIARDYDGHPVRTAVHVELVRNRWNYSKMNEIVAASQDGETAEDGTARLTFTTTESGSFTLKSFGRDDRKSRSRAERLAMDSRLRFWRRMVGPGTPADSLDRRQEILQSWRHRAHFDYDGSA